MMMNNRSRASQVWLFWIQREWRLQRCLARIGWRRGRCDKLVRHSASSCGDASACRCCLYAVSERASTSQILLLK